MCLCFLSMMNVFRFGNYFYKLQRPFIPGFPPYWLARQLSVVRWKLKQVALRWWRVGVVCGQEARDLPPPPLLLTDYKCSGVSLTCFGTYESVRLWEGLKPHSHKACSRQIAFSHFCLLICAATSRTNGQWTEAHVFCFPCLFCFYSFTTGSIAGLGW